MKSPAAFLVVAVLVALSFSACGGGKALKEAKINVMELRDDARSNARDGRLGGSGFSSQCGSLSLLRMRVPKSHEANSLIDRIESKLISGENRWTREFKEEDAERDKEEFKADWEDIAAAWDRVLVALE